jgi:hypothetical protein
VRAELEIPGDWLFPSTKTGKPWGKVAQYNAAQQVLKDAGIDVAEGGSFRLRHTFALRKLRRGKTAIGRGTLDGHRQRGATWSATRVCCTRPRTWCDRPTRRGASDEGFACAGHDPANPLSRPLFSGRHEATVSVHGRPFRSLATNREPAVSGQRGAS